MATREVGSVLSVFPATMGVPPSPSFSPPSPGERPLLALEPAHISSASIPESPRGYEVLSHPGLPAEASATQEVFDRYFKTIYDDLPPTLQKTILSNLLDVGKKFLSEGNALDAATFFSKTHELDPNCEEASMHLGLSLIILGNLKGGTDCIREILCKNSTHSSCLVLWGLVHVREAQKITDTSSDAQTRKMDLLTQAANCFQQLVEDNPSRLFSALKILDLFPPETWQTAILTTHEMLQNTELLYASHLIERGDKQAALDFLLTCGRGWYSKDLSDPRRLEGAMRFPSSCLTIDPEHQGSISLLATSNLVLRALFPETSESRTKYEEAAKKFFVKLSFIPDPDPNLFKHLAGTCAELGHPMLSLELLITAAKSLFLSGKFEEALSLLDLLLEKDPHHLQALLFKGASHWFLAQKNKGDGECEIVIAVLTKLLPYDAENFLVNYLLGLSHLALRRKKEACIHLEVAQKAFKHLQETSSSLDTFATLGATPETLAKALAMAKAGPGIHSSFDFLADRSIIDPNSL